MEDARLEQDLLAKMSTVLRCRRQHAKVGVAESDGPHECQRVVGGLEQHADCGDDKRNVDQSFVDKIVRVHVTEHVRPANRAGKRHLEHRRARYA